MQMYQKIIEEDFKFNKGPSMQMKGDDRCDSPPKHHNYKHSDHQYKHSDQYSMHHMMKPDRCDSPPKHHNYKHHDQYSMHMMKPDHHGYGGGYDGHNKHGYGSEASFLGKEKYQNGYSGQHGGGGNKHYGNDSHYYNKNGMMPHGNGGGYVEHERYYSEQRKKMPAWDCKGIDD